MTPFLFTKAVLCGEPVQVFNNGEMERDYTYIDEIVESLVQLLEKRAGPNPACDVANQILPRARRGVGFLKDSKRWKALTASAPRRNSCHSSQVMCCYHSLHRSAEDLETHEPRHQNRNHEDSGRFMPWYRKIHVL